MSNYDLEVTINEYNLSLQIPSYDVEVSVLSGAAVAEWGEITGSLTNQTDLQNALDLKANIADLDDVAFSGDHTDLINIGTYSHDEIDSHIGSTSNPHGVTPTQLNLVIGTDVQAWDANLDNIAGLTPALSLIIGDGLGDWETVTPANFITDNNILTTSNTKTVTNKTISGLSNTLSNIADSSLSESYLKADGTTAITDDWNVDGSDTLFTDKTNSRVGIGTTSPGARLDIKGSGADILNLQDSSGDEKLTVLENGNVGIGTTSPLAKLHVDGAITQNELSADPSDPDEGSHVIWQSDGTGSGDDGDILVKINVGGTIKTTTLIDFSSL